jgi:hypothetical protein
MIIRHPTGLYQDSGQIPIKDSDSGNITYVISNDDPARSLSNTVQLTSAEEMRSLPQSQYDDDYRRQSYGELIYTVVDGNESIAPSNKKLFSIGQILDFEIDDVSVDSVAIHKVDVQHNTNLIDYSDSGLSDEEIDYIMSAAQQKKMHLESEISSAQSQIKDTNVLISDNQKKINETKKIIFAVSAISDVDPILEKLNQKYESLIDDRDKLIETYNELTSSLSKLFDDMLKISELVK